MCAGALLPPAPKVSQWSPNREPDTLLKCGCSIPWPIITLLGSGKGYVEKRDVWCDLHGWQKVSDKDKADAKKRQRKALQRQETLPDEPTF